MLGCENIMNKWFVDNSTKETIKIIPVVTENFVAWLKEQAEPVRKWIELNSFTAKSGEYCLILEKNHVALNYVLLGVADADDDWAFGDLARKLPIGVYEILAKDWSVEQLERATIAWGLGSYCFAKYKKTEELRTSLFLQNSLNRDYVINFVEAICWARDLINMPNHDLGPEELTVASHDLAKEFSADMRQIIGGDLLKENFPGVYAVGKGSLSLPRLIELRWGNNKKAPLLTLIGKGVCFDSGGWDIKPSPHMRNMKDDMAGAAHVLALARLIMQANLPVRLHVILPVVENLLAVNSYKPGDILTMRNGKTVEIFDTDAEGRLILADALTYACEEKPDLLMDFATLTGSARVALGEEITAMFTPDHEVAHAIGVSAALEKEPLWRMPLYEPYLKSLESSIADFYNCSGSRYGGSITAALFLQQFIEPKISWVHFDLASWNEKSKPGRPEGGDVLFLRGLFKYLQERFSHSV